MGRGRWTLTRGSDIEPWSGSTSETGGSEGRGEEDDCASGARTTSCGGFWEVYVYVLGGERDWQQ